MTARIDFGIVKQGSNPTLSFTWPLPSGHAPTDWTGATLSGTLNNLNTGDITAITGTLTVVAGPTRSITWAMSDDDTGTNGVYKVTLLADVSGTPIYTLNGDLQVEENPEVTAVAGPGLVGIATTLATWLAALKTAVQAFTSGNLVSTDGDTLTDSGISVTAVALKIPTENEQTGTAYTLVLADADKIIQTTNGSAVTITVPPNASVAFAVGVIIGFEQYGAGQVTFAPGAGVTIRSLDGNLSISGQYGVAGLRQLAADEWLLWGALG